MTSYSLTVCFHQSEYDTLTHKWALYVLLVHPIIRSTLVTNTYWISKLHYQKFTANLFKVFLSLEGQNSARDIYLKQRLYYYKASIHLK